MHDHSECDDVYHQALREGRDGYAEYLATRCDRLHAIESTPTQET